MRESGTYGRKREINKFFIEIKREREERKNGENRDDKSNKVKRGRQEYKVSIVHSRVGDLEEKKERESVCVFVCVCVREREREN